MTIRSVARFALVAFIATAPMGGMALAQDKVGVSPWGQMDELGRLNMMTDATRAAVLARISGGKTYDMSVEYFIGMPGWEAAGDPRYQMWMTHTPRGNVVTDSMNVGDKVNAHVGYTGSAFSMYSHTGTHIDALNHFGIGRQIYNGFSADQHLGDRGWGVTGAETIPPIIARGVLIDIAKFKNLAALPPGYRVVRSDIEGALRAQNLTLKRGDVVMIRTGRMKLYEDAKAYTDNAPGLGLDAAKFLVETSGAMIIGADNLSLEAFPSEVEGNYIPVHTYLLAQHGVPIMELVNLEALAADNVYEFAFIGASLKLRGADAAPMRPIAIPLRRQGAP